jgi:hypothetical protein
MRSNSGLSLGGLVEVCDVMLYEVFIFGFGLSVNIMV